MRSILSKDDTIKGDDDISASNHNFLLFDIIDIMRNVTILFILTAAHVAAPFTLSFVP
jgi:hypothetical protein